MGSYRSFFVALVAAAIWACSPGGGSQFSGDDEGSSSSSAGGAGGGIDFGGNASGGGCPSHCSSDLHHVVDCNGAIVSTCPDDQGCSPDGTCKAPCTAADENASTIGCDFYAAVPGPMYENRGSCFAALIANTWTTPVTITASHGGTTFDAAQSIRTPTGSGASITYDPLTNGELLPGQIAIVFLTQYPSGDVYHTPCPAGVVAGVQSNTHVDPSGLGQAFHITTDRPVVAYDIYPYGGASSFVSSATLLVPTPTWGDNFIAADSYEANPSLAFANGFPFVQIVAAEEGTTVTMNPVSAVAGGGGVPASPANTPATYNLGAGQLIQFMQPARLAGSPIAADKPISVWAGSSCMNIPIGSAACDSGHQQLLPVNSLGNEYLAVRYRDRVVGANEVVPWMLVGIVDGTQLTYEPAAPSGAPTSLSLGQVVEISSSEPFIIRSQDDDHPFYFASHMTGATAVSGNFNNDGDPDTVNVIPPAQFLDKYLFLTDPTYGNTNLVFTRGRADDGNFKEVALDCVGALTGWTPIGSGDFEFTRVDLVQGGVPVGGCDNGVHTAESEAPFGLTVWGFDVTASYGYPAGMSVKPINTVVVPPTPQ